MDEKSVFKCVKTVDSVSGYFSALFLLLVFNYSHFMLVFLFFSDSVTTSSPEALVMALKSRLKELENCRENKQKCLICMVSGLTCI